MQPEQDERGKSYCTTHPAYATNDLGDEFPGPRPFGGHIFSRHDATAVIPPNEAAKTPVSLLPKAFQVTCLRYCRMADIVMKYNCTCSSICCTLRCVLQGNAPSSNIKKGTAIRNGLERRLECGPGV